MDRTTAYAKSVVSGAHAPVGRLEMLACKRHLEDMKKGKEFGFIFDVKEAEKFISLANELTIAEGEGPVRLKTRGFQDFIIGNLWGWRHKRSTKRRFREAYIQIARQNGKSFLSGAIGNQTASFAGYHLGRIFCTATKQDQANIVWDEVAKFIQADKHLLELYDVTEYKREIKSKITGTVIKAIGKDTKSVDGFRSILAIVDEYHAHKNNQMYKLMLDGQVKVDSALTLAITTAGFDLNAPAYEMYKLCTQILEGLVIKESQFVYITQMDPEDDIWDQRNWAKANPLLLFKSDGSIDEEMMATMAEKAVDAKEKGGEDLLNFQTKTLNTWVGYSGEAFVDAESFQACGSDLTLEHMREKDAYLGIDLSSGGDLTSIALLFPIGEDEYFTHQHSFMPELRLMEHERTDDAPYRIWVNQGLMTLTTGGFGIKTDYSFIIAYLKDLIEKYGIRIKAAGYDAHNASAFLADLDFLNCPLIEVKQSAKALHEATADYRLTVKSKKALYDKKDHLWMWSVANAELTQNSFGEFKIAKRRNGANKRIDTVDALIDAWAIMLSERGQEGGYDPNEEVDAWLEMMKRRK